MDLLNRMRENVRHNNSCLFEILVISLRILSIQFCVYSDLKIIFMLFVVFDSRPNRVIKERIYFSTGAYNRQVKLQEMGVQKLLQQLLGSSDSVLFERLVPQTLCQPDVTLGRKI